MLAIISEFDKKIDIDTENFALSDPGKTEAQASSGSRKPSKTFTEIRDHHAKPLGSHPPGDQAGLSAKNGRLPIASENPPSTLLTAVLPKGTQLPREGTQLPQERARNRLQKHNPGLNPKAHPEESSRPGVRQITRSSESPQRVDGFQGRLTASFRSFFARYQSPRG